MYNPRPVSHDPTDISRDAFNRLMPIFAIWVVGTAIKHPVPDQVEPSFVIFDIRAGTLIVRAGSHSARMSKILNDSYGCHLKFLTSRHSDTQP